MQTLFFQNLFFYAALPAMAYFFGSVSSAIVVCRLLALPDPRAHGSGNPGATNVLRAGGGKAKRAAAITLLCDWLKGLLPVLLALFLGAETWAVAMCGAGAFLGHLFPLWFGFRGGKGVAVAAGVLAALSPALAAALLAVWVSLAVLFRYSSVSSLGAAVLAPAFCIWLMPEAAYFLMTFAMSMLVFWRHQENMMRLAAGSEDKIQFRRGAP